MLTNDPRGIGSSEFQKILAGIFVAKDADMLKPLRKMRLQNVEKVGIERLSIVLRRCHCRLLNSIQPHLQPGIRHVALGLRNRVRAEVKDRSREHRAGMAFLDPIDQVVEIADTT